MAILGSNTPSTTSFLVKRQAWWFSRFTPTQDFLVKEIWVYCAKGTYYSDRSANLTVYLADNTWNNTTHSYGTLCYKGIGDLTYQPWGWRGGNTNVQYTVKAGTTYNWWFLGSSGYSDAVDCQVGYTVGTTGNTAGVSFVSNYWDPHNVPTYNQNSLPSTCGSGDLVITGPPITIGGKTPGKLEHTSWANIASLK